MAIFMADFVREVVDFVLFSETKVVLKRRHLTKGACGTFVIYVSFEII